MHNLSSCCQMYAGVSLKLIIINRNFEPVNIYINITCHYKSYLVECHIEYLHSTAPGSLSNIDLFDDHSSEVV